MYIDGGTNKLLKIKSKNQNQHSPNKESNKTHFSKINSNFSIYIQEKLLCFWSNI
jgi:hypothetical protein